MGASLKNLTDQELKRVIKDGTWDQVKEEWEIKVLEQLYGEVKPDPDLVWGDYTTFAYAGEKADENVPVTIVNGEWRLV